MSDTIEAVEALRALGHNVSPEPLVNGAVFHDFEIIVGRHAGKKVAIALALDLPATPPAGIHIHPAIASGAGVSNSGILSGWQYISRRHDAWRGRRDIHAVLAYIHKVLGDV